MFKCGDFKMFKGDMIDFNNLEVPCTDFVTITITEDDVFQNEGHTMLIQCTPNSDMTIDFKLQKGNV